MNKFFKYCTFYAKQFTENNPNLTYNWKKSQTAKQPIRQQQFLKSFYCSVFEVFKLIQHLKGSSLEIGLSQLIQSARIGLIVWL